MNQKEVKFTGLTATIKRLKVRDRLVRTAIYQKLNARFDDVLSNAAWEYAGICTHIVTLEGCEDWTPTTAETPEKEANAQFEAWLNLPISIGDWLVGASLVFEADIEKKAD
jgi:hypothetical protein